MILGSLRSGGRAQGKCNAFSENSLPDPPAGVDSTVSSANMEAVAVPGYVK